MSDSNDTLRRKALRAARAVTMGLALAGATACSDDTSTGNADAGGWDTSQADAADTRDTSASDTAAGDTAVADTSTSDTAVADTSTGDTATADTSTSDTATADTSTGDTATADTSGGDTAVADGGATCSETFDDVCPESCEMWEDADCCETMGGIWSGGGCAVPGPFVPPEMVV